MDRSDALKLGAGVALIVGLFALVFTGGQTQAILSTVGASIGSPDDGSAGERHAGGDVSDPTAEDDDEAVRIDAVLAARQVVFTGSLSLQVTDLAPAVGAGDALVARLGGYVGGSRMSDEDETGPVASITYRIPAARWSEALEAFRTLGTVIGEETDAAEVTGQLVDLEARLRNLRASETALQRIASEATAVKDVLDIEKRLTELRGEIERLDAQRASLADQVAFATLTVTYGREVVAVVEAAKGWSAADEVDRATATLVDVLQTATSAGIWFAIVWLPILVALAILALVARFVARRIGLADPARRMASGV